MVNPTRTQKFNEAAKSFINLDSQHQQRLIQHIPVILDHRTDDSYVFARNIVEAVINDNTDNSNSERAHKYSLQRVIGTLLKYPENNKEKEFAFETAEAMLENRWNVNVLTPCLHIMMSRDFERGSAIYKELFEQNNGYGFSEEPYNLNYTALNDQKIQDMILDHAQNMIDAIPFPENPDLGYEQNQWDRLQSIVQRIPEFAKMNTGKTVSLWEKTLETHGSQALAILYREKIIQKLNNQDSRKAAVEILETIAKNPENVRTHDLQFTDTALKLIGQANDRIYILIENQLNAGTLGPNSIELLHESIRKLKGINTERTALIQNTQSYKDFLTIHQNDIEEHKAEIKAVEERQNQALKTINAALNEFGLNIS